MAWEGSAGPRFFDSGGKKFPGKIFEMLMALKPEGRPMPLFSSLRYATSPNPKHDKPSGLEK